MTKELFNNIAPKYDFYNNIISFYTHYFVKKFAIKQLNIKENSKILDLCCGSGDMGRIAKDIIPSVEVIGVDFSEEMLKIAKSKNPDIEYSEQDGTKLEYENNSFDYVIIAFGLRNIKDKEQALFEIYRVLKPNGKVLHLDFGKHNVFSKIYDYVVLSIIRLITKNTEPYEYLIQSKNSFPEPKDLIKVFERQNLSLYKVKNLLFGIISFQVFEKTI